MPYWLPPALALPKKTPTLPYFPKDTLNLFFLDGPLDRCAAWAISRRMEIYKEGDPYTLGNEEWHALRTVLPFPDRSHPHLLEAHDLGEGFSIFAAPFFTNGSYAGSSEDHRCRVFFLARQEGRRMRLYPRALRARHFAATCTNILTSQDVAHLAPAWHAAFDALPAYATTLAQKHAGSPYIAASIPLHSRALCTSEELVHSHPFWVHAKHALCAAFSLRAIPFPPRDFPQYDHYHWTAIADPSNPPTPPAALRIELPCRMQGWPQPGDATMPAHSPDIDHIARALGTVLARLAPTDMPLFFDTYTLSPSGSGSPHPGKNVHMTSTGQFFPATPYTMLTSAGTRHHALHHLHALPQAWRTALQDALATP